VCHVQRDEPARDQHHQTKPIFIKSTQIVNKNLCYLMTAVYYIRVFVCIRPIKTHALETELCETFGKIR
jgi:hypothetical protein